MHTAPSAPRTTGWAEPWRVIPWPTRASPAPQIPHRTPACTTIWIELIACP
jgi:hypothetical protein